MMKRSFIALLLATLLLGMLPGAFAVSPYAEAQSALEAAQLLSPRAKTRALFSSEDVCLHVLSRTEPETCGAVRAVHYADYDEYILVFASMAGARAAYDTLKAQGFDRCWIDEALAAVADEPEETAPPAEETTTPAEPPEETEEPTAPPAEETEQPEESAPPEETPAPSAEPSPELTPSPEPTPYTPRSWGAAAMGLDLFRNSVAVEKHTTGRSVTVAVLDTGADLTVQALKDRAISKDSYDFVNKTADITDVTRGNSAGHGTRVATLLDDLLPRQAELMLLRVFAEDGATMTDVRLALQYALEYGADVINMSMGWDRDPGYTFLNDVLQRAYTSGVPVVCAAGNSSTDASDEYPANHPTTIAVSAINRSLNYDLRSNFGDKVDFTAPGAELQLIAPGGEIVTGRGTSFSAPHIAAAAADVLLCEPDATVARVYYALRTSATDLGDEGKDWLYGWGLPQMTAYVSTAISHLWDSGVTTRLATRDEDGLRVFTCSVCGETRPETIPATRGRTNSGYTDVPPERYYAAGVTWAVANGITYGTSESLFSPLGECTRAEMVTFLWRAAGRPEPAAARSPFVDVFNARSYYYKAVLWAVEQGITAGTSETTFSPDETVTRAQTVALLWRMAGRPEAEAENPFGDVKDSAYYYKAVLWAVQQGITAGTTPTTFEPNAACTRSQIVSFLYRDFGLRRTEITHDQNAA